MNLMEQASFAEIAQLVEHDLAKVGVASSSLVFRSGKAAREGGFSCFYTFRFHLFSSFRLCQML